MNRHLSIVLAVALAGAGIFAPAWAQAAATVAARVVTVPSIGGAGAAGLAAGNLWRTAPLSALGLGGLRFGLTPLPFAAQSGPSAVWAEDVRAVRTRLRAAQVTGAAPARRSDESLSALAGARGIAARLGDAPARLSVADRSALLDRFFSGSLTAGDGEAVPVPRAGPVRLRRSESGYVGPGSIELRPYRGPKEKRSGTTLLNFPTFHRAPLNHPIETFGLYNCAALVIIDRRQGRHFMAHVTEDMPASALERVLREEGIAWEEAEIHILPGADAGTKRTVSHIRAALARLDKAAAGRVRFAHFPVKPDDEANLSIVSHGGNIAFAKTGRLGSFKLGGKYFQGSFPR